MRSAIEAGRRSGSDGGRPLIVRVDTTGHVPEGGARIGILPDGGPQRFLLNGTGADGAPASVELPVPAKN